MEEKGIGRPSTYAPTISTILERNYVEKQNKYLAPTELGIIVTRLLAENFERIIDTDFTAKMEESLDEIELGKRDWVETLEAFYAPFHELIEKASSEVAKVEVTARATGEKCPLCQTGDLVIKEGRYGKFVACSDFPDCKYTTNVQTPVSAKCPTCGSGLVSRESRKFKGRVFYTCDKKGSNPECAFISWDLPLDGQFCEVCGNYMVMKKFRGKSYTRCSNRDCSTNHVKKTKPGESQAAEVTT
jgi:DNA topoisomerase-1